LQLLKFEEEKILRIRITTFKSSF